MTIHHITKRPVTVQAVPFDGENFDEVRELTGEEYFRPKAKSGRAEAAFFTAEVYDVLHDTWIGVAPGMVILKGTRDECYPCERRALLDIYEEPADGWASMAPWLASLPRPAS